MSHNVGPEPSESAAATLQAGDPVGTDENASPSGKNRWMRLHARMHRNPVTGLITKVVVTVAGLLVILAGLVMMITPGPGLVAILLGLAILSTEWAWAARTVTWLKRKAAETAEAARAMDPAVRRRRLLVTAGSIVAVSALVVGYLLWQGWPNWCIEGWDRVQAFSGLVPELPGM